jgi:hypothetical protein
VPKYAAIKAKVDTKGTIITGGDAKDTTKTTIDSVTLTWTAGRPAGEKLSITVSTVGKNGSLQYKLEDADIQEKIVYGTDKNGNLLATLKLDKLVAGTKYKVEISHAGGSSTLKNAVVMLSLQAIRRYSKN